MLRPPLATPDGLPGQRLLLPGFELEVPARELRRTGARRGKRLTVKAQQVLLTLALRPGEVLSREQLMDAVWPDSYPTGDVLTQAIVQLRRALDDDVDAPRYIETIARSGYRLLGEVTWAQAVEAEPVSTASPAAHPPPRPRSTSMPWRTSPMVWVGLALVALGIGSVWWTISRPAPAARVATPASAEPTPVILASTPAYEHSPAISPDGRLLVFAAGAEQYAPMRLYLQSIDEFHARPLTTVEEVWDHFPAWSPDQQWVAFRRRSSVEAPGKCEIRLVSVVSGVERLASPCEGLPTGLDFTADGRSLILGGYRDGTGLERGLWRIDLETGERTSIPVGGGGEHWDSLPRVSADGRWIAFRRGVMTVDLFRVPLDGGPPEAITRLSADIRGLDWLGDSGAVVMSLVNERGQQLYVVDQPGLAPRPLMVAGGQPGSDARGRQVVFEQSGSRYMLRRLDIDSGKLVPAGAMGSSRNDMLPSLAPDGSTLAFFSDRSGELGVWLAATSTQASPQRVADLQPHPRFTPAWSADSMNLLVVADGPQGEGLYEVEVASRRSRYLSIPAPLGAYGYLDDTELLVNRRYEAGYRLQRYARSDGRLLGDAGIDGVGFFQVDLPRMQVLYTREGERGLHAAGLGLEEQGVIQQDLLHPMLYRAWRVVGTALWFMRWESDVESFALWRLPLADLTGAPERVLPLASAGVLATDISVRADSTLQALWISEQTPLESDIAKVTVSPPAASR